MHQALLGTESTRLIVPVPEKLLGREEICKKILVIQYESHIENMSKCQGETKG